MTPLDKKSRRHIRNQTDISVDSLYLRLFGGSYQTSPLLGSLQIILFFCILKCQRGYTLASFTLDADISLQPLFRIEHPLTTARAQYADEVMILLCQFRYLRKLIIPRGYGQLGPRFHMSS